MKNQSVRTAVRCPLTLSNGICYWKDMWHKMNSMRQSWQLCDVTLWSAGQGKFMAHSAVLAASSDKLCKLLVETHSSNNSKVIYLNTMPKEVLQTTLDFIYGLKPESSEAFQNLRLGALILNLTGAREYCDQRLKGEIKGSEEIGNLQSSTDVPKTSAENESMLKAEYRVLTNNMDDDADSSFSDVQAMPFCPKPVCLPGGCEASHCNNNLSEILYMDTDAGIKLQPNDLFDATLQYDNIFTEADFLTSGASLQALDAVKNIGLINSSNGVPLIDTSALMVSSRSAQTVSSSAPKMSISQNAKNSASRVWRINPMLTTDLDQFTFTNAGELDNSVSEIPRSSAVVCQSSTPIDNELVSSIPSNHSTLSTNQRANAVANFLGKSVAECLEYQNTQSSPVSCSVQNNSTPTSSQAASEFCKLPDEYVTNHCHGLVPPRDPVHDALVPRLSSAGDSSIECPHLKKVFGQSMEQYDFDLADPADVYNADEISVELSIDCSDTLSASNPSSRAPSSVSDTNYDFEPASISSIQSQSGESSSYQSQTGESSSYQMEEYRAVGSYNYYVCEDSLSSLPTSSPSSLAFDSLNQSKAQHQHSMSQVASFSLLCNNQGSSSFDVIPCSSSPNTWSNASEATQENVYSARRGCTADGIVKPLSSQNEQPQRTLKIARSLPVTPQLSNSHAGVETINKSANRITGRSESLLFFKDPSTSRNTAEKVNWSVGETHQQKRSSPVNVSINCEDCEAILDNVSKLRMHQLKVHGKGRLFTCSKCDFRSPRKKDVQAHLLSQHEMLAPGVRVYSCKVCSYQCIDKNRYEEHEAMHSGEPVHKCTLCGKGYTTRRGMRTHLKYHSASRPHQCNICGAAFKVRAKLADHVKLLHEQKGVKPYKCSYCSHTTALRGNCNQHIRKNHPDQPITVIDLHAERRRSVKDYDYAGLKGAEIYEDNNVSVIRTI